MVQRNDDLIKSYSIVSLNECAALLSFGNVIDVEINQKVIAVHQKLVHESFEGFIESVPSYSSIAVFYRSPASFEEVKKTLQILLSSLPQPKSEGAMVNVPVLYDGDDLEFVAQHHRLSIEQVISIHTSKSYRVFMLGFLPGFPYMGAVDPKIATPRKATPRTFVTIGSVGIAGTQTGVYPQTSPGGWQLIGRTPVKIFDAQKKSPCLFQPGDLVKFYPITEEEFEKRNEY